MGVQRTNGLTYVAMLLGCTALPVQAWAQDASPPPPASTAAVDPNEIIVTAQRRAERLENVPVSITALTATTIANAGVKRIDEIQQIASGVQINKGGSFTQPAIRGISTLTLGYGFENNVAVYVDGFYQNDMVTINQDLGTVQSVQVLKGPQGTLYGRNATGGAIVIDTVAPSDTFTVSGTGSYGRLDDKRLQGYVAGPLTSWAKFGVAAYWRDSDGYIRDLQTGAHVAPLKNTSIRAKLELDPVDNVKLTFGYNHGFVRDDRGLIYVVYNYYPSNPNPLTCPNPNPVCANQPQERADSRDKASVNGVDSAAYVNEYTLTAKFDTDIGTLSSYTGYAHRSSNSVFDFDASKAPITFAQNTAIFDKTWQQTLDYAINAIDRVDLVVGVFLYRDRLTTPDSGSYSGDPLVKLSAYSVSLATDAMAFYADGTYHLTDKLFLTAGGRYSTETRQLRYNFTFPAVLPEVTRRAGFDSFTPRAVIRYELAPRTNVYASFSKGFRSGVFNPVATANPAFALPVKPEKITAYEIGLKTASRALRFDTASWYYDFRDLQVGVSVPDPTDPSGLRLIQRIGNAKKARSYGAEAQLQYTPLRDLNLRAGMAYIHSRYVDFKNAVGTAYNAATGFNQTGQVQDWSGQQAARAPTWSGNAGFDYTMDFLHGRLALAANGSITSSYVVTNPSLYGASAGPALADKQRYRQPRYAIVNAQLNWTAPGDHYTLGLYADNFTNTRYTIIRSGGAFGDYREYNEPATYGVRAGFKF